MYPGKVNSPITKLMNTINSIQTTMLVVDGTKLPDAPNLAVIGINDDAETILYTVKNGNELSGVTRGFQGVAKSWDANSNIARFFTAYDYDTLRENVDEIDDKVESRLAGKTQLINGLRKKIRMKGMV